jgi:hypothetical protein
VSGSNQGALAAGAASGEQDQRTFQHAALVACHPDDEILWFGSIISHIPCVIIAFLHNRRERLTQGRIRSLSEHPKKGVVSLRLKEAGVFGLGGRNPELSKFGIEIDDAGICAVYQENYERLVEQLRPLLKDRREVYTHNPWGEYGHPEHVQVYCAIRELQQELGFRIWFSNYVSKRAEALRLRLSPTIHISQRAAFATDLDLARTIQRIYVSNHCWTWYQSYRWPEVEEFLSQEPDSMTGQSILEFPALLLNQRLGAADRLRWMKTQSVRALRASSAGRLLTGIAGRIGIRATGL